MSPLIIAMFAGIIYLLQITILFNIFVINDRAKFMVKLWLFNLPIVILCYVIIEDKSIISNPYIVGGPITNLVITIFFYFAGFFGGILQLYNLADRGFSLRILIDLLEHKQNSLSLDEVINGYSQGNGISWMYQKRLADMSSNRLIVISNGYAKNTSRGERLARLFRILKSIINLHENRIGAL